MENTLATFIKNYILQHSITINDLAKNMDVPHSTVARWVRGKTTPSIYQLAKLAEATQTDLCHLVYLVAPDAPRQRAITPTVASLIDRINKLPKDKQEFIDAAITGISLKRADESPDKK